MSEPVKELLAILLAVHLTEEEAEALYQAIRSRVRINAKQVQ